MLNTKRKVVEWLMEYGDVYLEALKKYYNIDHNAEVISNYHIIKNEYFQNLQFFDVKFSQRELSLNDLSLELKTKLIFISDALIV